MAKKSKPVKSQSAQAAVGSSGPNQSTALPDGAANTQNNNELATLVQYVNSSDDMTMETRELAEKCRRYYDSEQWTRGEVAKLAAQKQAATVINRIKPKMDALMGMEKANRTTVKTFARTPKHEKASVACTESIRYVLQDNFYEQVRSAAWENGLIEGTMGVEVIVVPQDDENRITINHLMWDRLIYDPHSRRKDFSDARYLGQVVWMDYDDAIAKYPNAKDILETMQNGSATYDDQPRWMDNTRRRVKIVELYYRKSSGEMWYACFTRGGYCEAPKISPYVDEEGNTEWAYEFASLFVTRSGGRYGAVNQYLDVQDEINKRRSKALHLMSVRQVRWERGAVEDINKARQELAKPDGVLETTPGMEFEVLKTGDMAAAQFNLLAEAKSEIDAVGFNAAASGKDSRDMSGVALRQRQMSAQTELGPMFDCLKHMDIRVYRKVWNRIRQYWKAEKYIRITDDENNLKWVGLNKPMTKGEQIVADAQQKGVPPEELAALVEKISADPMMKEMVGKENDLAELDMDIIIADAPDAVTTEVEDFQAMAEMVKSGFPIPPEAVIMASPISNKDQIIKMMKEGKQNQVPPQVQEQMQKMQEEMKKLTEENQALKADTSIDAAKLQAQTKEMEDKTALRKAELEAEFLLQKQKQDGELQLAREKADAEIALKREMAQADLDIEAAKLQQKKELDGMTLDHQKQKDAAQFSLEKEKSDRESQAKVETENKAKDKELSPKILDTLKQVVDQTKPSKRNISIVMSDGRKVTAQVE